MHTQTSARYFLPRLPIGRLPFKVILAKGLLLGLSLLGGAMAGSSPTIQGLGNLSGALHSLALGLSADGQVVVGRSTYLSVTQSQAFRWTQTGGIVGLGYLPSSTTTPASDALATSSDGSVIVGSSTTAHGGEAFRWTQAGSMVSLGVLPGGSDNSQAIGVSSDGSVVVGYSYSASGSQAFRWTQSGGMVGLGSLASGASFYSSAYGVSSDGSGVVGQSNAALGSQAFRWTQNGGMVGLGHLAGGSPGSSANAVNQDGSVIVGSGFSGRGEEEAFRWTASGMIGLGFVYYDINGNNLSRAYAVSPDGKWVVGTGNNTAFLWDATNGIRDLNGLLSSADHANWILTDATGIAEVNNTLYIVGNGAYRYDQSSGAFRDEAWMMQVPVSVPEAPGGGAMLIGLAGLGVMALRKAR